MPDLESSSNPSTSAVMPVNQITSPNPFTVKQVTIDLVDYMNGITKLRALAASDVFQDYTSSIHDLANEMTSHVEKATLPDNRAPIHLMILNGMSQFLLTFLTTPTPSSFEELLKIAEGYLLKSFKSKNTPTNLSKPKLVRKSTEVDPEGFQLPKKSAKPAILKNLNPNIKTNNQFDALPIEETVMDESSPDDAQKDDSPPMPKPVKPEPIYLKLTTNWRDIVSKINSTLNYEINKKVQGELLKIFPKDVEEFRTIQNYLSVQNCEFFTMKLKSERPRKVIIKGVPKDIPIEEVKSELVKLNYSIHRVSQLKNYKTKLPMPIFLIDVLPNSDFKTIYDITTFLGFFVTVEAYKFKGTKQCYRCQKFNHSSDNCTLNPICLKCAGEHLTNTCTVTERDKIKCINCQGNHTANYGGCPRNPKNFKTKKPVKTIREFSSEAKVKEGVTFSNALQSNSATVTVPTPKATEPAKIAVPDTANPTPITPKPIVISQGDNLDATIEKLSAIVGLLERIEYLTSKIQKVPFLSTILNISTDQIPLAD